MEPSGIGVLGYALGEPVGTSVRGSDIGYSAEIFASECLNRDKFAGIVHASLEDDVLMHARFQISGKSEDKYGNYGCKDNRDCHHEDDADNGRYSLGIFCKFSH